MVNMYSKPTDSPKKKTKPNIHYKSLNQKPQITKLDITKANLETKTSIVQRSQHYNTSQQMDRASPHRRLVSQHNSSSSPEHITSGFGHWRSLTGSDWRSLIGHGARRLARSHRLLRRSPLALSPIVCRSACSGAPLISTLRYFITSLPFFFFFLFFSLSLSLWLSHSLSLYLKN